jgi:hypothetical protein
VISSNAGMLTGCLEQNDAKYCIVLKRPRKTDVGG